MTTTTVKILATEDRIRAMPARILRLLGKDPAIIFDYVGHYMVDDDGRWLSPSRATEVLDALTMGDLLDASKQVERALAEVAVPNG